MTIFNNYYKKIEVSFYMMESPNKLLKHNIFPLFRTFSEKEQKYFRKYLTSDYFGCRDSLSILFTELRKYHPLYTHINCTKEFLYGIVYPGREYNSGTMRDLFSSLYRAALDFIKLNSALKDPISNLRLIREMDTRNLDKVTFAKLNEEERKLGRPVGIDSEFFNFRYKLEAEKYNYNVTNGKLVGKSQIIKLTNIIEKFTSYLLLNSALEIFSAYTNLLMFTEKTGNAYAEDHIQRAIKKLKISSVYSLAETDSKFSFVIDIYSSMLSAYSKKGSWNDYLNYRIAVHANLGKLSADEISFQYARLISCALIGEKYSKNKQSFIEELSVLYNTFLSKGYYKNKKTNFIPANLFRAIVIQFVKTGSLNRLHSILQSISLYLEPKNRDNMKLFGLAYFYFSTGHYDKAIENISRLDITDFIFKNDIYTLKIRILYEQGAFQHLEELLHTFRQFLHNEDMMPALYKRRLLNFVQYVDKLIRIAEGSKKYEAGLMIQKLNARDDSIHKDWLIEKLNNLESLKAGYYRAV